jgi:class 3 adenylate cyclase/alpha-beta hydrolase superfamily lysophospholipase
MSDEADVRYALSNDARLAFTVRGESPNVVVLVPSWLSNQDVDGAARLWSDLIAPFATVVSYDQRGTGLSDPVSLQDLPTLESWTDDLDAIVAAVGAEKAVLVTHGTSASIALMYAATRPERTRGLVLVNGQAAVAWSDDYDIGAKPDVFEAWVSWVEQNWGTGEFLRSTMPAEIVEQMDPRVLARYERLAIAPSAVGAIFRQQYATDVRALLPTISTPTLIAHTAENAFLPFAHSRYLAEHIPDAQLIEIPGADVIVIPNTPAGRILLEEIEEFVTGTRAHGAPDRFLTTLLFSDVVGSTDRVETVGDRAWRVVLDLHDEVVRRELENFSGQEQKSTGDGFLATFDGPARAVRCGDAICKATRQVGLDVRIGIHTGEVERRGPDISGIAVHLANRVCSKANAGEVLVTRTVVDLVAGSGINFDDRGEHELKGISTPWHLYALLTS